MLLSKCGVCCIGMIKGWNENSCVWHWIYILEGIWDAENPYTRNIGTVQYPINKMLAVAGKLWCGCQNVMKVINPLTLSTEVSNGQGHNLHCNHLESPCTDQTNHKLDLNLHSHCPNNFVFIKPLIFLTLKDEDHFYFIKICVFITITIEMELW